jgi:hypothetical protein
MDVELIVYNLRGRAVRSLVNGLQPAGEHRVGFEAEDLSSGLYRVQLKAEGLTLSQDLLLVK